jgi:hypothetical protein
MVTMKKIIIPRRDHEVYFIPVPETLKMKQVRLFAIGQLEKLHPGFSAETALDIKRLVFNKTRWVMATVMEAETLVEYRVLNKGAAFFTNTSIAVHKKDFLSGGVQAVGDESIGYDSGNNTPVSIPLDTVPYGPCESGKTDGFDNPIKAKKNVPAKCKVYATGISAWRMTTMIACAALLTSVPLFLFPAAKDANETIKAPFAAREAELTQKLKYPLAAMPTALLPTALLPTVAIPTVIEILTDFSADFVFTGGKITRWQYSEGRNNEDRYNEARPHMVLETRGIDVLSLRRIFNKFEYVVLEDISVVRYIDGEPYLTVLISARKGYAAPPTGTFFSQSFSLPIFSDLTGELKRNGIAVVSETLPSAENGNALYTVTYTAKDSALIRSMEIISGICDKYPVRVKGMDISIGGESDIFTVVCSLSQSDAPRYNAGGPGNEKTQIHPDIIPTAFGYRKTPPPLPPKTAVVQPQIPQVPQIPQAQKAPEISIVGSIRDDKGQMLFYREAGDSKIIIKDTP